MLEKIEQAKRRASEAREKALTGDDQSKDDWLRMARMWDDLAKKYEEILAGKKRAPA